MRVSAGMLPGAARALPLSILLIAAPYGAFAQSLAQRLGQVRDGTVRRPAGDQVHP